ncbi:MAG: hypothetical protein JHC93_02045 [Parachlamydiales bacterium]|nr:hypothetical protein [Parachlamydiales bacterium]
MKIAAQIFDSLEGEWSFKRIIPNQGEINGRVVFHKENSSCLKYREEGVFSTVHGDELNSYRDYYYTLNQDRIDIFFDKDLKNLFQSLIFNTNDTYPLKLRSSHLCSKDLYEGTYTFENAGQFNINYVVNGPKKNYTTYTVFKKVYGVS